MKKLFPLFLLLGLLWGCASSVSVSTDYDRSANFTSYTTYKWYQDTPPARRDSIRTYNTFLDKRIKSAVEANMAGKGFRLVDSNPDILVAYDVKVVTKQELNTDYGYYPGWYGPGWYGYGWWYGYRYNYGYSRFAYPMYIDQYQDGTIIIDLVDARDNELVWRGWGQMRVDNENISQKEVDKIVSRIFEKYPPGAKKKK